MTATADAAQALQLMRQQRFGEAVEVFDRMDRLTGPLVVQRRLAANLASVAMHRPALLGQLLAADISAYRIEPGEHGGRIAKQAGGVFKGIDPYTPVHGALTEQFKSLTDPAVLEHTAALAGIGDGRLLVRLAEHQPSLPLGKQRPVVVFEPEPAVLLMNMMLHDLTGPTGPLEQQRFRFHVGDWQAAFEAAFMRDPREPFPTKVGNQACLPGVEPFLNEMLKHLSTATRQIVADAEARYAAMSDQDLADLLRGRAGRRPRALLITSLFTSVLQFSTRDTAEGLRELGWDTHVVVEQEPWQRVTLFAIARAVEAFAPDIMLQLNHLRYEHDGAVPPSLPFFCWVQDSMPNIRSATAGKSVGRRDFVLSTMPDRYVRWYGYPAEQMIYLNKATRVPPLVAATSTGPDVVFVSTASRLPEQSCRELLATHASADRMMLEEVTRRIVAHFEAGDAYYTPSQVQAVAEAVEVHAGRRICAEEERRDVMSMIWERITDPIHRQQSLTWAAEAAERLGFELAIFGRGWDKHPRLSRYARGPVKYGPDLENLTRAAKINLQLVPYHCTHQRLLDGIGAGGFFLIRHHPANLNHELARFFQQELPAHLNNEADALAHTTGPLNQRLREYLDYTRPMLPEGDLVQLMRGIQAPEVLVPLPHLKDVSFASAPELAEKIAHYLARPEARRDVVAAQRGMVETNLTYAGQFRRVLNAAAVRLAGDETPVPCPINPVNANFPRQEAA